jgi:hypothetical protein
MNKIRSVCLGIFWLISFSCFAQLPLLSNQQIDFSNAVTTLSSGNWSNPAIWSSGVVPTATTDVIISNNHTVYIDMQGSASGVVVDLCRNLQVNQTAVLQMGHNTSGFEKDLRINGSLLCNGTFSAGRVQPTQGGDGSIYSFNSRIFMNLNQETTYISGSGFFNPRILSISSTVPNRNVIIDLYNTYIDENFVIRSTQVVNVTITKYAYVRIKGTLGVSGSTFQFSPNNTRGHLTIEGIVVTNDISLFTRNTNSGQSSSITIASNGSLFTRLVNQNVLNRKTEAGGFTLNIQNGGLFRLWKNINFENLTTDNPHFTYNNNGELRKHYSSTMPSTASINAQINQYDPNLGASVPQIRDIFGATHIAGWYNFTDKPFMIEGLDFYKDFGPTSIKTTISPLAGKMFESYPFNHSWPNYLTMAEVAQDQYIDSLFQRSHIQTYTFWTNTRNRGNYRLGPDFNHNVFLSMEQQFYDLTVHILQNYGNTNKTFVYQNWEGDWMLRGEGVLWENNASLIPGNVEWIIEGMSRMFRAQQRGTERARHAFPNATAKVMHGIEFNKLWMLNGNGQRITMMDNNTPSVLENVIPHTRIDLSSWSAYDGGWTDAQNPEGHAMWKGIEIAKYFTTASGMISSGTPVQIGEFGINENPPFSGSNTNQVIRNRYGKYIGVALGLQIPNFYLWNLYNSGSQAGPAGFTWQHGEQYSQSFLNTWLDGKWIVRPDGSWGFAAAFLMEQWASTLSSTTPEIVGRTIIFPNPASDVVNLLGVEPNTMISILDSNGRIIRAFYLEENNVFSVKNLSKGVYHVCIHHKNKPKETQKLVVN